MIEGDECDGCDDAAVVPVLDKGIERSPTPGNKFRQRCLACGRWHTMTSEEAFRSHDHPHVLPLGEDGDAIESLVPLEDYQYGPEWRDLAARIGDDVEEPDGEVVGHSGGGKDAMTDGGVNTEPATVEEEDDEPENLFVCPYEDCETEHTGYPEECGGCGGIYNW